jgi:NADPH:quinone reductase-like Zn-dependent oxidoreductase
LLKLPQRPARIDIKSLIFERKRIEGFWLSSWLRTKKTFSRLRIADKVQKLLATELNTDIQTRLPLDEAARGLEQYKRNMTGGKVLLRP